MHDNSLFLATYKQADVDYDGEDWVYPGLSNYRADTMSGLGELYGLKCFELPVPTGTGQTWLMFTKTEQAEHIGSFVARMSDPEEMLLVATTWQARYENLRRHHLVKWSSGVTSIISSIAKVVRAGPSRAWKRF